MSNRSGPFLRRFCIYTADGLRIQQAVNGDLATFAWDWAVPGVPELLQAGDTRYLVGHDTLGHQVGNDWRYYLPDHLGSVRQSVDAAGNLVTAREWTPYGEEVGEAQAGLGFTGEWFDAAVGLQYLRARWYQPGTGRFTQSDAIMNTPTYQYASANPINRIDPSGYIDWSACVITGAYGTCVLEQGDTLYKIARELQGAGIQSQVGLSQVVRDIIGYNPALQVNPNYIKIGEQLTLPTDWISALQAPLNAPTVDALVIVITPRQVYLPQGVLQTTCFAGCSQDSLGTPLPRWREDTSNVGEFLGSPAVDHLDAVLQSFQHGISGLEGGLPYGNVYNFVVQIMKDADTDTCPLNRGARGITIVLEQTGVGWTSMYVAGHCGMGLGTAAGGLSGGNLGVFGGGYIVGWGACYLGSYHVIMMGVDNFNEDRFFPWLENTLCK